MKSKKRPPKKHTDADEAPIVTLKPRNEALNNALMSKRGQAMTSDKTDHNRAKDNQQTRKEVDDL